MRICPKCRASKSLDEFYPNRWNREGRHTICKECVKADRRARYIADPALYAERNRESRRKFGHLRRNYNRELRQRVLDEYGNRCMCCGEATPEFLGIDHVNNDGEKHRRELKGYGRAIYQWLKKEGYPKDGRFQLLCHNCNMAKGMYGSCPHQRVA